MGNSESNPPPAAEQARPMYHAHPIPCNPYIPYRHTDGLYHCDCGSILTKTSVASHLRTVKHQTFVISKQESYRKPLPSMETKYPQHILKMIVEKEKNCPICYEDFTLGNISVTSCGHSFCQTCRSQIDTCPLCRTKFNKAF